MSLRERVLATMKSEDTESSFELYVTRTPGYLWALVFRALHVHPIAVTLLSIVIGTLSGYFFSFNDLGMNLIGMGLLVWANWYDCADGQLARMTNQRTLVGRLLDGLAGDIWFLSIYLGLAWRIAPIPSWTATRGWWIWLILAYAGFICHARQCALADYYRNIHLWFQLGRGRSELDTTEQENRRFGELGWRRGEWFEKMYLFFYRAYTRGQEEQTPRFQQFFAQLRTTYGDYVPQEVRERFRQLSRPLMRNCNILTFDTRVGVLFLAQIMDAQFRQPIVSIVYPLFEILVLEPLRFYTRSRHEGFCQKLHNELVSRHEE